MMNNWYEGIAFQIIALLSTITTGFLGGGWLARRKAKLEAEGTEITNDGAELGNVKNLITMYKEGFADIKAAFDLKYDVVIEQYNVLKKENILMQEELSKLKDVVEKNAQMQREIEKLQGKVKTLEGENMKLKSEIKKLQP